MRAKKRYCIIAYDVSDNKRRDKVCKSLEKYGLRSNFSVFECMMTDKQLEDLKLRIAKIIDIKEDSVMYYPLCLTCYANIARFPEKKQDSDNVTVI